MILNRSIFLTVLIFLLPINAPINAIAQNSVFSGTVIKVIDGDSILVKSQNRTYEVRLGNIDAPEYNQPYGAQCHTQLSNKIYRKNVTIKPTDTDKYGRTIGIVTVGQTNINKQIVADGCAWAYRKYLTDNSYIALEQQARRGKMGLWSLPQQQIKPPWLFRSGK